MPFSIRPFRRVPLTYLSGFTSLIALLLLSCVSAYAEWVPLGGSDSGTTAYVDTGTLQPNGIHIKMWVLYDFETMHTATGGSFFSSKAHIEYDCTAARQRTHAYTRFSGHMGSGNVVVGELVEGRWMPIAPKSVGQMVWAFACSKE